MIGSLPSLPLLAALAALDPDEREALVDHAVVERPWKDVASTLGVSGEQARRIGERARVKMAARLR